MDVHTRRRNTVHMEEPVQPVQLDLTDAINDACDVRGDDDANRQALIDECMVLPADQQCDLLEHFGIVAATYRAIVEGPAP